MRAGNQECNFDFAGFELPINTSWHSQLLPLTLGKLVAPHGHASVLSITAGMLLRCHSQHTSERDGHYT